MEKVVSEVHVTLGIGSINIFTGSDPAQTSTLFWVVLVEVSKSSLHAIFKIILTKINHGKFYLLENIFPSGIFLLISDAWFHYRYR